MPTMSKEYMRNYYHKNKDKYKARYNQLKVCEHCQVAVTAHHWSRHCRTAKHKRAVEGKPSPEQREAVLKEMDEMKTEIKVLLQDLKKLSKTV